MPIIFDPESPEAPIGDAYCTIDDLLVGDMEFGTKVNPYRLTVAAAREIDSRLGHLYDVPFNLEALPVYQATKLVGINAKLASGRIIMALATPSESDETHQYGKYLVDEALKELEEIKSGGFQLGSGPTVPPPPASSAPLVGNLDASSRVEDFYGEFQPGVGYPNTVGYWGAGG